MEKTLKELNQKVWYRLLKVIFVFFILASISMFNGIIIADGGFKRLDNDKTLIYCTKKDKKIFTPKQANMKLSSYQFQGAFDYQNFFEGYNEYDISTILEKCYDIDIISDIFVTQRTYELTEDDFIYDISQFNSELNKITTGYKTNSEKASYLNYSIKLFDIKIVYTYMEFIKYFILGNFVILLTFEILRRVFYYIVLGKIIPKKINK